MDSNDELYRALGRLNSDQIEATLDFIRSLDHTQTANVRSHAVRSRAVRRHAREMISSGIILVLLALAVLYVPMTSKGSISAVNRSCRTTIGAIGGFLSSRIAAECRGITAMVPGAWVAVLVGAALTAVGLGLYNRSKT